MLTPWLDSQGGSGWSARLSLALPHFLPSPPSWKQYNGCRGEVLGEAWLHQRLVPLMDKGHASPGVLQAAGVHAYMHRVRMCVCVSGGQSWVSELFPALISYLPPPPMPGLRAN